MQQPTTQQFAEAMKAIESLAALGTSHMRMINSIVYFLCPVVCVICLGLGLVGGYAFALWGERQRRWKLEDHARAVSTNAKP